MTDSELWLARARAAAAAGDDETAKAEYLALICHDPTHLAALLELAALAEATGHLSAAQTAYQQAVNLAPDNPLARTGLANRLRDSGETITAEAHYRAALAVHPAFAPAHQGLAQLLTAQEDPRAEFHWQAGFAENAVVRRLYRGTGAGIPLLMLVAARGGNVPTGQWIDDRRYAVTEICADFADPAADLPPHNLVINAIGDADACAEALARAHSMVQRSQAPIINHPSRISATGRQQTARSLAHIPGIIAPRMILLSRANIGNVCQLGFPLLLRSPGFHTGQHFLRVASSAELDAAAATLPGDQLLGIEYLDATTIDGLARKYRVMFIDSALYPLHLAISTDWKVHYFSAAMQDRPDLRDEESRFLHNMRATLGERASAALDQVQPCLGVDYGGIDFALSPDGSLLLFEANATMVITPPDPHPMWDYRRTAIDAALDAARHMVERHALSR